MSALAQRARIDLCKRGWEHSDHHNGEVLPCIVHDERGVASLSLRAQVKLHKVFSAGKKEGDCGGAENQRAVQFIAEGLSDSFVIPLAVKLRGEEPRARDCAEDAQEVDEHELIDNGNA